MKLSDDSIGESDSVVARVDDGALSKRFEGLGNLLAKEGLRRQGSQPPREVSDRGPKFANNRQCAQTIKESSFFPIAFTTLAFGRVA